MTLSDSPAATGSARALARPVPETFDQALVRGGRPAIDVALARAQHALYREHLETAGYDIEEVPTDERYPDCVFIEDTAVIIGSTAVITRTAASSRRGEAEPCCASAGPIPSTDPYRGPRNPGWG